ncbi:hypothetical protein GGQ83_000164 [Roseococcus suduntuyensis]|uniref:Uncharacterized protein n=1 Tax=Roseococcus suduntuyensis TaxID=455361 RepID=A0A840A472_9PROT|nr:hypothetical protein [Roseococcus suduntuyensis]
MCIGGLEELLGLAGYYTAVSFALNTAEVSLPEGAAAPSP